MDVAQFGQQSSAFVDEKQRGRPERIAETIALAQYPIPEAIWEDLTITAENR
jgi:hypothetical protein